jgi:hypothetical protein
MFLSLFGMKFQLLCMKLFCRYNQFYYRLFTCINMRLMTFIIFEHTTKHLFYVL